MSCSFDGKFLLIKNFINSKKLLIQNAKGIFLKQKQITIRCDNSHETKYITKAKNKWTNLVSNGTWFFKGI